MDASIETVSYIIPTLIAAFTVPVIWRFAKSIRSTKIIKEDEIYQDKDGQATEESMKEYSTKAQFIVVFVSTGLGVAASFALSVLATIESMELEYVTILWLLFWSWVRDKNSQLELLLTVTGICIAASFGCVPGNPNRRQIPQRRPLLTIIILNCDSRWICHYYTTASLPSEYRVLRHSRLPNMQFLHCRISIPFYQETTRRLFQWEGSGTTKPVFDMDEVHVQLECRYPGPCCNKAY
jgi:hypothetical protein